MNGVKNEIHVRVEQTARGIWYCTGADIYEENHVDIGVELDLLMTMVEGILDKHNKLDEMEKQHTDLSAQTEPMKKALKVR